jgi:hypothetical protein
MLLLPAAALAGVSPQVIVNTTFEDAAPGPLDGQVFGGGAWFTPWYGGTNEVNVIADPTGAGRGQVAAFQTTGLGNTSRLVVDRLARPPLDPGAEWYFDPVNWPDWHDAYYPYGIITYEFDYFCLSNLGDWTNFMANYRKGWDYFEDANDRITVVDVDGGIAGWDWHNAVKIDQGPLPVDTWFTITIEYTCKQPDPLSEPIASTYDYYINGVQTGDDIKASHWNDNYVEWNFELLDDFLEMGGATTPAELGLGYVLIDRVEWTWEAPEPSILAIGGFGLVALLLRRRKK